MSNRDLLLEIGLEELPARFVTTSMTQLADKVSNWLAEKQITHGEVTAFSTPRRLAVYVKNVAEAQADIHEEAKGPAKKIALTETGEWSKAAIGFSRGQGMSVDDIYFKEINGVEYAHVNKFIEGKQTSSLLPELEKVVVDLTFPKNMRWANHDLRYIRPIKWLLALFGTEVIPFSVTNVVTNRITMGHRFLGQQIELSSPSEYEQQLLAQFVIADPKQRKEKILSQIKEIEKENNWVIQMDEDLLEEVNNLLEYPTALYGRFEDHFLKLPEEVLVTSMKEHQRYFSVRNEEGDLLPFFVTVRNGNADHLETVARGNEKVLRARLADAEFFYEEDQRMDIPSALKKLETVVYHEEIGTITEKMARVRKLTNIVTTNLSFTKEEQQATDRAAEICKFDLVTQMVNEFPELQGFMGEKYAQLKGEKPEVARAIDEHYQPRQAGDHPATTNVGAALSIADKLDTIASFFAIGVIPTGSQDPYALRRQATGMIETLISKNWTLQLEYLFDTSLTLLEENGILKQNKDDVKSQLLHFFQLRLKHALQERGIRYDIIEALLTEEIGSVPSLIERANLLNNKKDTPGFKEDMEALSRVLNIARNKEKFGEIDEVLFENEYEQQLFDKYSQATDRLKSAYTEEEYYELLISFRQVINQYFDHTMIMADDEKVRQNRLNQMIELAEMITSFANVNEIIVK